MILTNELLDNTQAFLRRLRSKPFYIEEPSGYCPGLKVMLHTRLPPGKATSIIGLDRVAFCAVNSLSSGKIFASIDMDCTPGFFDTPCYWLPWMKDGIVRIKLKPSKKLVSGFHPQDNPYQSHEQSRTKIGAGKSIKGAGVQIGDLEQEYQWKPRVSNPYDKDVRLFFTGMMDGCSTWVAGDPREPEVYHVNCATYQCKNQEVLMRSGAKGERAVQKGKFEQMKSDFAGIYQQKSLVPRNARSANAVDVDLLQHKPGGLKGKEYNSYFAIGSQTIHRLVSGNSQTRYRIMKTYYTAFGVKTNDLWAFYRQTIYEYKAADESWNTMPGTPSLSVGEPPVQFFP